MNEQNKHDEIPKDHPRYASLIIRHQMVDSMKKLVVTESGLIAHGRGEAFDYLIGEKTNSNAIKTMEVAVASLMLGKHSIISVNGNTAALCPENLVTLSKETGAGLEINLFYGKPGRLEAIEEVLRKAGAENILGTATSKQDIIQELTSNRRFVDPKGIKIADVVLVPLEDGDRTEALVKEGKTVIAIDLNPLSRTAQKAHITIVDNIIRCIPKMIEIARNFNKQLKSGILTQNDLQKMVSKFDNKKNLSSSLKIIQDFLSSQIQK
jgi:4-phosphopantoate--beta-alanine ligase